MVYWYARVALWKLKIHTSFFISTLIIKTNKEMGEVRSIAVVD